MCNSQKSWVKIFPDAKMCTYSITTNYGTVVAIMIDLREVSNYPAPVPGEVSGGKQVKIAL